MERIMRRKELLQCVGLSYTQVWKMEKENKFPPRRQLSAGLVGWISSEIDEWLKSRPVVK